MANSSTATTGKVSPLLAQERENVTFSIRDMRYLLGGGQAAVEREEQIRAWVREDPAFSIDDNPHMSRTERFKNMLRKMAHAQERMKTLGVVTPLERRVFVVEMNEMLSTDLHDSMFMMTLVSQMSGEQAKEWIPLAARKGIIGTYAQTELGHGSNLSELETTATYDAKTQEFVLHSPTLTATKWWPGGLGKTSTHCIVMARLLIKDHDYGMHAFLVQLRRQDDHTPLPGIQVGDIGPKIGFVTQDNGFLRFDHVRIPRTCMLMKHAQVAPDGTYTRPPHDKLTYGTMLGLRANIVRGGAAVLGKAVTIATRYSVVRQQFSPGPGIPELSVIEYQTQQYKLLPLLATVYAFSFTGTAMMNLFMQLQDRLAKADFSILGEVHATSSGLKAFTSSIAAEGVEICRQACGGHGYSQYSGLPALYVDAVAACTYEGENTLMYMQHTRYLIKIVEQAARNEDIPSTLAFLRPEGRAALKNACAVQDMSAFISPDNLLAVLQHRAARLIFHCHDSFQEALKSGLNANQARSAIGQDMVRASSAHCAYSVARRFADALTTAGALKRELTSLFQLYCLHRIELGLGEFAEDGFFTPIHCQRVREAVRMLLPIVRRNAVGLVDALGHSDHVLNSSLGRYDGNVYEDMYRRAQRSELNRSVVVDGYQEYLRPFLTRTPWPVISKL